MSDIVRDIRAIVGEDGETYINAKDIVMAMKKMAKNTYPTLSVFNFIKTVAFTLITEEGGDSH